MRTRGITPLALALSGALLVAGCGSRDSTPSPETEAPKEAMITLPVVRNLTYLGLEEGVTVTLDHGHWEGDALTTASASKPTVDLMRDFILIGDVDGDDSEDGLVFLRGQSGGSGNNIYWALVQHRDDQIENTALRRIGDRVQVMDARFEHDRILLDLVGPGPDDPIAAPGEVETRIWEWNAGTWRERVNPNPTTRLTLGGALEDSHWRLRALDDSTSAPETPEVTLSYASGKLSGRAGCNTYSAAIHAGRAPGEIAIAAPVATRMACPDSIMRIESRFLSLLPKVERFGFAATQLALQYDSGGKKGRMYFERVVASEGRLSEFAP